MKILSIKKIAKSFGGLVAVKDISLDLYKGEILGLIGPNGAGKTTLFNLISGYFQPDSGEITYKDENIIGLRPHQVSQRGLTRTFQIVKPFRRLPVMANVLVASLSPRMRKKGEWVKTAELRARDALEFCGILDFALEPAAILSHGDLKRLELARAIATGPELLLLDEPFGGLNPGETTLIAKSLKRLHRGGRFGRLHSEGPAMIIVEHKLADLMKIVDRVVVINFGRIITTGTPEEIAKNEEVIEAYTGKR